MRSSLDFLMYHTVPGQTHFDFHSHDSFELVYYVRGRGHMYIGQDSYRYRPGTMTLTRPRLFHDERHDEETEVIFIGFRYDDDPAELHNGLYEDEDGLIHPMLQRMRKEMKSPRPYHALQMDLLTGQIVLELLRMRDRPSYRRQARSGTLASAIRALEENCLHPVDLHDVAAMSGYSFHRFRHLFKDETGLSPLAFVIRKRMEHAKRLLVSTEDTISAIALDSGFSSSSQFGSMFREHYGVSPSDYRKSHSRFE